MKMANGYGSVYKLSGKNRRRPWAACITVSYGIDMETMKAQQQRKSIGYFERREDALAALVDYHRNPYDVSVKNTTFAGLYDKWSAEHYPRISESNVKGYQAAYKVCEPLYNMVFANIRHAHLQGCIDNSGKNMPTLKKVRSLFAQLYKYAMRNDLVTKDYSAYVDISQAGNPNAIERQPFTMADVDCLWSVYGENEYFSTILMLIYTGVRVSELLDLKKENVNLEERWFDIIASKTEAGIRRVPIAKKVLPFFEYWFSKNDCEYLLSNESGKHFSYDVYYRNYWEHMVRELGLESHKPHDTRHTCVSMLTAAGIKPELRRKIVGHSGKDVHEKVYTHFEIQQLLEAIDQI
jgi:site-specific recombinase XerD